MSPVSRPAPTNARGFGPLVIGTIAVSPVKELDRLRQQIVNRDRCIDDLLRENKELKNKLTRKQNLAEYSLESLETSEADARPLGTAAMHRRQA